MSITVVIPTIPPRQAQLAVAVASVQAQELPADEIIIATDTDRRGAAFTRTQGLDRVTTEFTAFLDDDDEFYPQHLQVLHTALLQHDADYVFSWYDVAGGTDPRAEEFGLPWSNEAPRQTTITTLVRTELAQEVGGFYCEDDDAESKLQSPDRHYAGEDWRFTLRMMNAGAKIIHVPARTWKWNHHGANTSGLPSRW